MMFIEKHLLNPMLFFKLVRLLKNFPFRPKYIEKIQFHKVKKLLIHSYEHFEFYKDLMNQVGFNPFDFRNIVELEKIPIIDKDMYRNFTESVVRKNPELYGTYYHDGTSGSTGVPLKIYRTWSERAYMLAKYLRTLFLNGYRIFDATFSVPSPHRIAANDSVFQKFGIMPRYSVAYTDTVQNMVQGFLNSHADVLYANKSQLVQMADYIERHHLTIEKPKLYVCAAETLDENSKRIIQRIFGKDNIISIYGSVEFNNLAFQLKGNNAYHFNHDTNILELEDTGGMSQTKGYSIITDLYIYSFPLIRYKLGDWIETTEIDDVKVIAHIKGRMDDWITFKDGSKLPFHHFYEIMEQRKEISQFRIIQESYELIRLLIVLRGAVDKKSFEANLLDDLKNHIGPDIHYLIEYQSVIEADPNGKLRMVISNV